MIHARNQVQVSVSNFKLIGSKAQSLIHLHGSSVHHSKALIQVQRLGSLEIWSNTRESYCNFFDIMGNPICGMINIIGRCQIYRLKRQ